MDAQKVIRLCCPASPEGPMDCDACRRITDLECYTKSVLEKIVLTVEENSHEIVGKVPAVLSPFVTNAVRPKLRGLWAGLQECKNGFE